MRSIATSDLSSVAATLAIATWVGLWPPWVIVLVVVHLIVIITMRILGPIADAVGSTRATLIRRQVEDPGSPSSDEASGGDVSGAGA